MRNIYKFLITILAVSAAASCTKYGNDINLEDTIIKQENLNTKIQKLFADAPNGWLLLMPSADTTIKTAFPVLLQFDTLKGTYKTKSPFQFSNTPMPTLYGLSSATGAPLLSFSTGSIFSVLYEGGVITDYYFKVLDAAADTITVQPYRKGTVYASEGGISMKMIRQKAPLTWFDNPLNLPAILTDDAAPLYQTNDNPLKLTYLDGYVHPTFLAGFDKQSAGNLAFFQANVPFSRDLKAVPLFLYLNNTGPIIYYSGNNTLINYVDNGFTPADWFSAGPKKVTQLIRTNYLMVRSVSADLKTMNLFAVDKNGKEIITGTLKTP